MIHDPTQWKHTIECQPCNEKRKDGWVPQTVYVGVVPGGSKDSAAHQWHMRGFDKEMDTYKGAVDNGLNPSAITMQAVEAAERGYTHLDEMKFDVRLGDKKNETRNEKAKQQLADEGIMV